MADHWDLSVQRPLGFRYKFGDAGQQKCTVREFIVRGSGRNATKTTRLLALPTPPYLTTNMTLVGPFSYA